MKVIKLNDLLEWRDDVKSKGETIALTNGCFDLVHVGHLRSIEKAASYADHLVVAVNADESIRKLKGAKRPICNEGDRSELIAGFRCVSRVVLFNEMRLTNIIETLLPDYYLKGGDYTLEKLDVAERAALEKVRSKIKFFPIVEGVSTTDLVEKIQSL